MRAIHSIVVLQIILNLLLVGEAIAKQHAVVIGIADYPNANSLAGPVDDVKNMYRFLVETQGYKQKEIKMLTEGNATRNNILSTLQDWLIEGTQPGDNVLFYFSGHGFQINDTDRDEKDGKDEAIAAYDVAINEQGQFINMITDDEIGDILDQLNDRDVTVIIDSCHSGTLTRGLSGELGDQYAKTLKLANLSRSYGKDIVKAHRNEESFVGGNEKRVVWSAVSSWQKALVDFESRNGSVFTNLYIKGIRDEKADKDGDAAITRSELLDYIRDESNAFCKRNTKHCRMGLTPTLETTKDLFVEDMLGGASTTVATVSTSHFFDQALAPGNELIRLNVLPGNTIKAGRNIQVKVNSHLDGYLMIFDVRDSGEVVQLFPNAMASRAHQNGRINRNRTMLVPDTGYGFHYEAFDPGSSGRIYAIVSEDKLPEMMVPQKDLIVENPKQYVSRIATSLRQIWSEDLINREINWSATKVNYRVIP